MKSEKSTAKDKVLTIIGTVLCVILTPILLVNLTLIAKSYMNQSEVPSVGGYLPLIVLTDSMYPEIESGDLIICHTADAQEIKVNDVIAFFDPAGNGTTIVTHRVIEVVNENGEVQFRTKGDFNNAEDRLLVPGASLVGVYQTRIPGAGNVAMFMQSTTGLIVCVGFPIIALIGYDMVRRRIYEKKMEDDRAELMARLEALQANSANQDK